MSLLDALLGVTELLFDDVAIVRRKKWNIRGSVTVTDNPTTQVTEIDVGGGALVTDDYGASDTVAVGRLGRFDIVSAATATLADGTANGDRLSVMWVTGSGDNLAIDMTNVDTAYNASLSLGSNGVRRINFVWVDPAPVEGVAQWHVESTVNYPVS